MSEESKRSALWVRVAIVIVAAAFAAQTVVSIIAVVRGASDRDRIDDLATETYTSLCALENDIGRRANQSQAFIDQLRTGERPPVPGITIPDLERSIAGQRSTLKALAPLDCPPPKEDP